jgi:hypothetical protein
MSNAPYVPYPDYPQYPGAGAVPPKPQLPPTVRNAFYTMLAGAGLQAVTLAVGLGETGSVRDRLRSQHLNYSESQLSFLMNTVVAAMIFGALVSAGLWIWMAYANKAGKNWARIVGTVFFGISSVSLIGGLAVNSSGIPGAGASPAGLSTILSVISWLVGLAAVVLLWNKQSGAFFKPPVVYGYGYGYPNMGQPSDFPVQPVPPGTPGVDYGQQPGNPWDVNPPRQGQ